MDPLIWGYILLAVGLILVVLEFFVPSGGVIGLSAFCCLVAAIVMAFRSSGGMGLVFMTGAVLGVPLIIALGVQWWPYTPMGSRILLRNPTSAEVMPDTDDMKSLLGKIGETRSLMMPSGAVEIDGKMVDAMSEGQVIELGQQVKVIDVRGMHVVVRPVSDAPAVVHPRKDDMLSQSIESLGLDDLNEPLR